VAGEEAADHEDHRAVEAAGHLCRRLQRPGARGAAQQSEAEVEVEVEVEARDRERAVGEPPYPERARLEAVHPPGRARLRSGVQGSNRMAAKSSRGISLTA
jgi:hypothetical protein